MDDMNQTHTLVLADGSLIQYRMNGNNCITDQDINMELLADENLVRFQIDGVECDNYTCTNLWIAADGTHFVLREILPEEWLLREINAKIEYLAMMMEVDM